MGEGNSSDSANWLSLVVDHLVVYSSNLWRTVSNPWSHWLPWFNPVGHKTKQKDVHLRKGVLGRRGDGERSQRVEWRIIRMHYVYVWSCPRTNCNKKQIPRVPSFIVATSSALTEQLPYVSRELNKETNKKRVKVLLLLILASNGGGSGGEEMARKSSM